MTGDVSGLAPHQAEERRVGPLRDTHGIGYQDRIVSVPQRLSHRRVGTGPAPFGCVVSCVIERHGIQCCRQTDPAGAGQVEKDALWTRTVVAPSIGFWRDSMMRPQGWIGGCEGFSGQRIPGHFPGVFLCAWQTLAE